MVSTMQILMSTKVLTGQGNITNGCRKLMFKFIFKMIIDSNYDYWSWQDLATVWYMISYYCKATSLWAIWYLDSINLFLCWIWNLSSLLERFPIITNVFGFQMFPDVCFYYRTFVSRLFKLQVTWSRWWLHLYIFPEFKIISSYFEVSITFSYLHI